MFGKRNDRSLKKHKKYKTLKLTQKLDYSVKNRGDFFESAPLFDLPFWLSETRDPHNFQIKNLKPVILTVCQIWKFKTRDPHSFPFDWVFALTIKYTSS